MTMWAGFILFCIIAILWLAVAVAAENQLKRRGYISMTRYAAYIQFMQDKKELNRLGIAQQLKRVFGPFAAFGISLNSMSLLGGAALYFTYAWSTGSASLLVWAWPVLGLFALLYHSGWGELISAVPTAGGSYHAALLLGGKKAGWHAGWLQLGGHAAMLAFANLTAARWLCPFLCSWTGWSVGAGTSILFFLLTALQVCFCSFGNAGFTAVQKGMALLQLGAAVALIGALSGYLWPSFGLNRLWEGSLSIQAMLPQPNGPAGWLVGILLLYRMMTGSGAAEHASEETVEPKIRLPWAGLMAGAYVYTIGFVLLSLLAVSFLSVPETSGDRLAAFLNLVAGRGGEAWREAAAVVIGISLWAAGLSSLYASSRMMGSMSRDRALPFSSFLSTILRKQRTFATGAVAAACLSAVFAAIACFLVQAGEPAAVTLLSLAILLQHAALLIPFLLSLSGKGRDRLSQLDPLWTVGKWQRHVRAGAAGVLAIMMAAAACSAPIALCWMAGWGLIGLVVYRILARMDGYEGMDRGLRRSQEELLQAERAHPQ